MSAVPRVINVTYREGLSSVYPSQVLIPLGHLARYGFETSSVTLAQLGDFFRPDLQRRWKATRRIAADCLSEGLHVWPSPPGRMRGLWPEGPVLRAALKLASLGATGPVHVQSRGPIASELSQRSVSRRVNARHVFDCRGIPGMELLMEAGYDSEEDAPEELRSHVRASERRAAAAARRADGLICVSERLRDYIAKTCEIGDKPVVIAPCCVDRAMSLDAWKWQRESVRARLALGKRPVLVYCGSARAWQCHGESVALAGRILNLLQEAVLLVVTTHPDVFRSLVRRSRLPKERVRIVSVPHNEVAAHLAAGDAGLLLRARSLVNEVSSPVKFAEYLGAGLPVLLTKGIGDASGFVARENTGIIIDRPLVTDQNAELAAAFLSDTVPSRLEMTQRCLEAAARDWTWETIIPRVAEFHRRLADV